MKKTHLLIPLLAGGFYISSCGIQPYELSEESNERSNHWTEEERRIFTKDGPNSLGIPTENYDYAFVVDPSLKIVEEDLVENPEASYTENPEASYTENPEASYTENPEANYPDDDSSDTSTLEPPSNDDPSELSEANASMDDPASSTDDTESNSADYQSNEEPEANTDGDLATEEIEITEDETDAESPSEDEGVKAASESEIAQCSKLFGQKVDGVKISGSSSHVDLSPSQFLAVKMTGNKNSANLLVTVSPDDDTTGDLNLDDETPYDIEGLCIIVAGNQPTVNVVVNDAKIGSVYYVATGNGAKANFEVKDGASMHSFKGIVKGNAGSLLITGEGDYSCADMSVKGNAETPTCGPNSTTSSTDEADTKGKKQKT